MYLKVELANKLKNNETAQNFAQRVSDEGVFFRCNNCDFEPEMGSKTDDLLHMNYCPKCGSQFESHIRFVNILY